MVYVTPKVMIITAPMMPLQFAMLAMVPPAILGVGCLGDSWENKSPRKQPAEDDIFCIFHINPPSNFETGDSS
jgi:hypothetical protein